jgi:protein-L-isoaspartate(D-aspartate) O-methyltransferase
MALLAPRKSEVPATGPAGQDDAGGQAMTDFDMARRNMVDNQLRTNKVTDARVIAAMLAVPREKFVPEHLRGVAYVDEDVALGGDRWLMEPMVLARMLQAAEIGPNDVVLDIGAGTGYGAAVCSRLGATVVALESDPAMLAQSQRILSELGADNVVTVEGPLKEGYPQQAPYDVIVVSGAVEAIPDGILRQLAPNGRLVAVVAEHGRAPSARLARNCAGRIGFMTICDASVPCLPGFEIEPGFVF